MELHIAQMQDGCNCTPNGLHFVRLESQRLERIAGALIIRLLGEYVHAALVQIMILGRLLMQIILTQLIVIGPTQQLLRKTVIRICLNNKKYIFCLIVNN